MKKLLMAFISTFALLFALTACNKDNNTIEPTPTPEPVQEQQALAAPVITAEDTIVNWSKVENAVGYVVYVNNEAQKQQTSTKFELEASEYGDYEIKVKAISDHSENSKYLDSVLSNIVIIGIYDSYLDSFIVTDDAANKTVIWNKVTKASKYTVFVDDEEKTTITEDKASYSYNYEDIEKLGKHTIKVVAKSNKAEIGPTSVSLEVTVAAEQLETPNVSLNTNVVTWDEVSNASEYVVEFDDVEYRQTNRYYTISDTTVSHKIRVKALSNTEIYSNSNYSKLIETKTSKFGYLDESTGDFTKYENTSAYVQVTNAKEFLTALKNARWEYTTTITDVLEAKGYTKVDNTRKNESNWRKHVDTIGLYIKNSDGSYTKIPVGTPFVKPDSNYPDDAEYYHAESEYDILDYTQTLTKEGTVHVIEIMNDLDLGYKKLSADEIALGIVNSYGKTTSEQKYTMSSMFNECGMSSINISSTNNLLIYSKNGSKILHAGFKINSCKNVCVRNLEFDEMWQWEDTSSTSTGKVGDMDAFGWAYFKISTSDEIWIDHCTFGKSYDGQIDISDSTFNIRGVVKDNKIPYGIIPTEKSDVHISWCTFSSGSDDKDGYLYKMMEEIEADYIAKGNNYLYYKALRDAGYTFDEILYGIAIPQKKAFLDGDANDGDYKDKININDNLNLSIAYCKFINIEDRLPKVRTGNVYMYGTIIDCTQYYDYLPTIKSKTVNGQTINAKDVVKAVNDSWKCAGVSHGYMASMEGSIYVKDSIIKDVNTVICNNESYAGAGGIIIENTRYVFRNENIDFTGSIFDENNPFVTYKDGTIGSQYFHWNNETQSIPFYVDSVDVTTLEGLLVHCGTVSSDNKTLVEGYYLKNPYTI